MRVKPFHAEIAQLVEHNLAKVGVASSSLVFRSKKRVDHSILFFCLSAYPNGRLSGICFHIIGCLHLVCHGIARKVRHSSGGIGTKVVRTCDGNNTPQEACKREPETINANPV